MVIYILNISVLKTIYHINDYKSYYLQKKKKKNNKIKIGIYFIISMNHLLVMNGIPTATGHSASRYT